jgi:hypothetical protein
MILLTTFMARDVDIFSAGCKVGVENLFFKFYQELDGLRREGKIDEKQFDVLAEKLREVYDDVKKRYCELEKATGD